MPKAMRDVFGETICELKNNPRIVVLDADLGSATKSVKFSQVCPERFLDVGIAEQNMIGIAAGLSACGMIPIAATFSIFITGRAFEQIRNTVAHGRLNVKLVGTHNGVCVGYDGATHEAIEDIALMRSLPNMVILVPADAKETEMAIKFAVKYNGPVYLRISRIAVPDVHDSDYAFRPGKGEILKEGSDVAIISTGIMTSRAIEAARQAALAGRNRCRCGEYVLNKAYRSGINSSGSQKDGAYSNCGRTYDYRRTGICRQ